MNVIFLEPGFPSNQREFVRALHGVGASVHGVGDRPYDWLDHELKGWLASYRQIASITDESALEWAVRDAQKHVWIDRLEAVVEAHVLPAAHVRERCEIPGTSTRTAYLCRDKVAMKEVLREAGVPTAASAGCSSIGELRDFAGTVGYPLIVKPRDAAGASGTYRIDDASELEHVGRVSGLAYGEPAAVEEFVEGHEGFYDTLTVGGEVVHDFISHYYPNVLEAMRSRWISPQIISTNRMQEPGYDEVKAMGRRVSQALGVETSATHMEWFFGPKGLRFSEIGCRPPGVGQWDSYCAGNEFDLYREWALAVCQQRGEQKPSRNYACGIIALRPDQNGRITGYEGTHEIFQRYGDCIVEDCFPEPGTPTQGVEAGYKSNAWLRVRHTGLRRTARHSRRRSASGVQVCWRTTETYGREDRRRCRRLRQREVFGLSRLKQCSEVCRHRCIGSCKKQSCRGHPRSRCCDGGVPEFVFLNERLHGHGRAGGGQGDLFEASPLSFEHRVHRCRRVASVQLRRALAVEHYPLKIGVRCNEASQVIGFHRTRGNRGIQAAGANAFGQYVPQGDAVPAQKLRPAGVLPLPVNAKVQRLFREAIEHDGPERVARVCVVGGLLQRGLAGHGAQHQNACISGLYRSKAVDRPGGRMAATGGAIRGIIKS